MSKKDQSRILNELLTDVSKSMESMPKEKKDIKITYKAQGREEVRHGKYDLTFRTVTVGGATFPLRELNTWMHMLHKAEKDSVRVHIKTKKPSRKRTAEVQK